MATARKKETEVGTVKERKKITLSKGCIQRPKNDRNISVWGGATK